MTGYAVPVPVQQLSTPEEYLKVLTGHSTVFAAGEGFAYNNGGYVVLALLVERAGGAGYHEQVRRRVLEPAGMSDTAFLRSDELPARAARGYLARDGLRTNVLHLPVVGVGDGGAYSTAADLHRLWEALHSGRIVSLETVKMMVTPRSDWPEESRRYGLGFHLHETGDAVWLEGYDAGVSFTSLHEPDQDLTHTVISNWTDGAWPIVKLLNNQLGL
jgi:CubicO group peptidase (beta-lactamase class C family)